MDTISIGEITKAPKRHIPQIIEQLFLIAHGPPRPGVTVPSLHCPRGNSTSSDVLRTELARAGIPF